MKKIFRKEVVVGLLVILALCILIFGINFLKGVNLFKASNYYYAVYNNVEGLSQSAPVTLNGFKVGQVRELEYNFKHLGSVAVEMSLDKSLILPIGTTATITTDLLGTSSIALELPADSVAGKGIYSIGDTIPSRVSGGMMASITDKLMPAVNSIIPKVDSLLSNLTALTGNPALHQSISNLDETTAQINRLIANLNATTAALRPITANINSLTGHVDSISSDFAQVSHRMRDIPVDSIAADIQVTITNLKTITAELSNPNSSLGKLTSDPDLYNNLNATVQSLDSLFIDIKKNPKRYINIKVF